MINEPLDINLLLSPFLKFVQKRVDERIDSYREDISKDYIILSDLFSDIYFSLTAKGLLTNQMNIFSHLG